MIKILSLFALTLFQSSLSLAQGIGDITIEPKNPTLNQPFKITINSNGETPACGLQINLGDGNTRDVRVEKFPIILEHTYSKEGNFSLAVNGKMIMRGLSSMFPCGGDSKTLAIDVGTSSGVSVTPSAQITNQVKPQVQPQQSSTSPVISNTQSISKSDFSALNVLIGKVWGLKDPMDSRSVPCDDLDAGGHRRRLAPVAEFSLDSNGNLKTTFNRFGKGSRSPIKILEFNQISKIGETAYRLKGTWINYDGRDASAPLPYETTVQLGAIPILKDDRYQLQGMPGTMSSIQPTELLQCTPQQVAVLGKTDEQLSAERSQKNAQFNASPEGKLKSLRDHYTSMMAVQDCYDIRKNYAIKYIDPTVFNNARDAMKKIETKAKQDITGLNIEKVWADATKEYAQSTVGVSLDINKKAPQNHTKENQSLCNLMAMLLIDAVPKDAPKKNF
jgi:hypothetical protein